MYVYLMAVQNKLIIIAIIINPLKGGFCVV